MANVKLAGARTVQPRTVGKAIANRRRPPQWDYRAVAATLALTDVHDVNFTHSPAAFARRLSDFLGRDISCLVSCPPSNGKSQRSKYYHLHSPCGTTPSLISPQTPPDSSTSVVVDSNDFAQFDTLAVLRPEIIIQSTTRLSNSERSAIRNLAREYFTKVLHRQRALIRREFVETRTHSGDLGSFLYRLLGKNGRFSHQVGFEAASVFIIDPVGEMLRLKGTTGLKSNIARSEISFRADERGGLKIPACYRSRRPRVEFTTAGILNEGSSAEATARGPAARAYWPIQLQEKLVSRTARRQPRPVMGVIRITNTIANHLPFNWLSLSVLEFSAESLYNIVLGFMETEESGFKREESFHSAGIVLDSVQKNLARAIRLLFEDELPPVNPPIQPMYDVVPRRTTPDEGAQLLHLLRTAYASAMDMSFQVERANFEHTTPPGLRTEKLYTDALFRAIECIPYMCIAHSVEEPQQIPAAGNAFSPVRFPPPVFGSPAAITSVFINILENAIKYRRRGRPLRIELDVRVDGNFVDVVFRDYGIGISADDLKKIPSRLFRGAKAKANVVRGSGLGLHWCSEVLGLDGSELILRRMTVGLEVIVRLRRADV